MKKPFLSFLIYLIVSVTVHLFPVVAYAQKDSIETIYRAPDDSHKVKVINKYAKSYADDGNYSVALKYAFEAYKLAKKVNYFRGLPGICNRIGTIYYLKGDYSDALKYQLENLKWAESLKNNNLIAEAYNELGNIYSDMGNNEKALYYYNLCLPLRLLLKDEKQLATLYNNLGIVYDVTGSLQKAKDYYTKALQLCEENNDQPGLAVSYLNIGVIYQEENKFNEAIAIYQKSLALYQALNDEDAVSMCYNNLGSSYLQLKELDKAKNYLQKALQIANRVGNKVIIRDALASLVGIDTLEQNYRSGIRDMVRLDIYKDSLDNEENTKKIIQEQLTYEVQKKEAAAKAEQDKKDAIVAAENKRQRLLLWLIAIAGAGAAIVAGLIFRSLQQNKKAKEIIEIKSRETEVQKHLVEEKQKEIIDSITYAQRLQQAILPSNAEIKTHFPSSFIYYQPKDIVAGDFYWMYTGTEAVYIAAADCTGHGVPGAMVSVVCSNALNRAVKEFGLRNTDQILNKTRELVIETFEKSDSEVKDGMDISLLRIEKNSGVLNAPINIQWSGANNSLWYILHNELTEVKPDKQPIGKYSEAKPFTAHNLSFPAADAKDAVSFYLFSDGYADQFSSNGKKLMKKKFKDIVLSIQNLSMQQQGAYLDKFHTDWKSVMEQTNDVLVIGIKM